MTLFYNHFYKLMVAQHDIGGVRSKFSNIRLCPEIRIFRKCRRPGGRGCKISDTCGQGGSKIGKNLRTSFMYGP